MGIVASKATALEWEDARRLVIETVRRASKAQPRERVALTDGHDRVLAEDLRADRDYPALDRSLRDGFAVRTVDTPGTLTIQGETRAGADEGPRVEAKHTIEIMTGAPMPGACDAVVMVEHVLRSGMQIEVRDKAEPGQFINKRGSESTQGTLLVSKGARIDSGHISALAMAGLSNFEVFRKPKVAILATGDELIAVEATPAPHQIRNSNSFMLAALVNASGGQAQILPVAEDTEAALTERLREGLKSDLLLISGGVSAGKYDLVKPCLGKLGAEFLFERVRIQPGQPTAFGRVGDCFVFGLPGNPGSSMVTFLLFARAALNLLAGQQAAELPIFHATFERPFRHKPGLTRFLPAHLRENGGLTHIPWQGSSDIPALARSNVFLIADSDQAEWKTGDSIRVMLKV